MAEYKYIIETGTVVPDTTEILTEVQGEYRLAFGDDMSVDPSTPQGVLINAEAIARAEVVRNNAALANQINPNIAGGIFLDAILALTGSERLPATSTKVSCDLTGVASTVIPKGSQMQDTVHGEVFETAEEVTLSVGGTATVDVYAVNTGPLDVAPNTITQILSAVLGWETVTNPLAQSEIGTNEQSDASARALRKVTLARQGSALPEAIIAAVYEVPGVKSLKFVENFTSAPVVVGPITLVPHSIYLCVDGGENQKVAAAILSKKSGGCNYNGSTTVNVTDEASGQVYPVKFDRPTAVPFVIEVTIVLSQSTSIQDPIQAVKDAIIAYVNGEIDGDAGLRVGTPVSVFELAGAVNIQVPGLFVRLVRTSTNVMSPSWSTNEIAIAINELATTQDSAITVITA